jgi:hypothetical protein
VISLPGPRRFLSIRRAGVWVGRQLMDRAVGFRHAVLWVLEGNTQARSFYARTGWAADGARKADVLAGVLVTEFRYRRNLRVLAAQRPENCRTPSVT